MLQRLLTLHHRVTSSPELMRKLQVIGINSVWLLDTTGLCLAYYLGESRLGEVTFGSKLGVLGYAAMLLAPYLTIAAVLRPNARLVALAVLTASLSIIYSLFAVYAASNPSSELWLVGVFMPALTLLISSMNIWYLARMSTKKYQ